FGDIPGAPSVLRFLQSIFVTKEGLGACPVGPHSDDPTAPFPQPLTETHGDLGLSGSGQARENDEPLGRQARHKSTHHFIVPSSKSQVALFKCRGKLLTNRCQVDRRTWQPGSWFTGLRRQFFISHFDDCRTPLWLLSHPLCYRLVPLHTDQVAKPILCTVPCVARI